METIACIEPAALATFGSVFVLAFGICLLAAHRILKDKEN